MTIVDALSVKLSQGGLFMSRTYENGAAAQRYDRARTLPVETLVMWMDRLRSHLPGEPVRNILDLGAGTGRYSEMLRSAFKSDVMAVEPSEAMRSEGKVNTSSSVIWREGSAERIPAEDSYFDLVWMSQIFHHLDNRQAAVREIRRTLRRGGHLAIRNATRENDGQIAWLACFPEAVEMDRGRMPFRSEIAAQVCDEGFEAVALETVYQQTAPSWDIFYDKISQRALSAMISISDEAFDQGLRRLKRWIADQPSDTPIVEPVDLLVFRAI